MLLVDHEIASQNLRFARSCLLLLALNQAGDNLVDAVVLVGRFLAGAADDQWRAGFVDQDRVDFVDDPVIVAALHAVREIELHVVAQVVKTELVVGSVGDICPVRLTPLLVVQVVHDHAHRQPKEGVDLAHPFGVALG